jgi:hypothetical protein
MNPLPLLEISKQEKILQQDAKLQMTQNQRGKQNNTLQCSTAVAVRVEECSHQTLTLALQKNRVLLLVMVL